MGRTFAILLILIVGCGGSTKPAESPTEHASEEPSSDTPAASSADAPAEQAKDEPKKEGTEKPGAAREAKEATPDDVRAVLQLVIDDESLTPLLHLEQAGRFPLVLAGPNLPDGVLKAGKPVKIGKEPESKKEAVLVFTQIDVSGGHATVKYRYDIEGVKGSAVCDKGEFGWALTRSQVTER